MPHSDQPSTKQLLFEAEQLLQSMRAERVRFEERYQDMTARFYEAQVAQREIQLAYEQAMAQCALLAEKLGLKKAAIVVLLPHYPHPPSDELQQQLAA